MPVVPGFTAPPPPAPESAATTPAPSPSHPSHFLDHRRVSPVLVGEMVAWASLACLLTLANRFLSVVVPVPPYGSLGGHLLAVGYLGALLLALLHTARAAVALPLRTPFLLLVGGILSLPSLGIVFVTLTKADLPLVSLFYSFLPLQLQVFVNSFLGPIGLSFLGAGIGRVIRHPNTLLASAGFSIFFDIVVVTMGTVAQLMRSGSNLIAAVSVGAGAQVPVSGGGPQVKLPDPISGVTIGPADVLFVALFLSSVHLMRLSRRATFAWMFVLLFAALVIVETTGLPIPALAPMGVAVLVANLRHGAFTPTERRDLLIGGVFAVFCAALMILWARKNITPAPPQPGVFMARRDERSPVFVMQVAPNSPAARSGLRPGDLVISVGGVPTRGLAPGEFERQWEAAAKEPDGGVVFRVRRRGEPKPLDLTLRPRDAAPDARR